MEAIQKNENKFGELFLKMANEKMKIISENRKYLIAIQKMRNVLCLEYQSPRDNRDKEGYDELLKVYWFAREEDAARIIRTGDEFERQWSPYKDMFERFDKFEPEVKEQILEGICPEARSLLEKAVELIEKNDR